MKNQSLSDLCILKYLKSIYWPTSLGKIVPDQNSKTAWWGLPWQPSGQDSTFPLQGSWVWSLVGELRSCMPHDVAKNKNSMRDVYPAAAAAKSLQSCPTLCNPIDGSPPGSPVPGILQARTLEWVAISFSNAWKWSPSVVSNFSGPHGLQPTRLLHSWDFPGKSTGVGCHCLLWHTILQT